MRIWQVCSSASWGGMEMSVGRLAELQRLRGHEVFLAVQPESPLGRWAVEHGLPLMPCYESGLRAWSRIPDLARRLKQLDPELIHVHFSRDLHRLVPLNRLGHRRPLIFTKHLGSAVKKRNPWYDFLHKNINRATAISGFVRRNLLETTVLAEERIDLVYPGTDVHRFRPHEEEREKVRAELGFKNSEMVVGMMGRMSPGKGYQDFMEAASGITRPGVKYLMIGGPSRGEEAYAAWVRRQAEERLAGRLKILGFKPDRERYLRALDVFVFPSHAESFGLALCEAMATGLPCVAYIKDGVEDIIDDGHNGLGARVREVPDLRQKIIRLLEDDRLRRKLGAAARATAVEKFSEERMLAGYEETYLRAGRR